MSDLPISKRLKKIASYVPVCDKIADIGTDHGYLAVYLLQNNRCKKAICCDININPLESAKKTFGLHGENLSVEFRLGSGIEPIEPAEVEVAVIAGMGGGLIQSILSHNLSKSLKIPYFVLQPQTEQANLRMWLLKNGFYICFDGYVSEDGKYYELMLVSTKRVASTEYKLLEPSNDLEFGCRLPESELGAYVEFLEHKREKYEKILIALPSASPKRALCLEKLATIETILRRFVCTQPSEKY